MAVMSESSSSFFSFSFFTRLSMARLAKPSFSPPCRWHIRLWTMLRQASLLLGGFTDMMLYDATGHKSKACYLWTHNVHSDQLILALDRYSDIEILIGKQTFLDVNLIRWGKYGGKDFLGKLGKFPEHLCIPGPVGAPGICDTGNCARKEGLSHLTHLFITNQNWVHYHMMEIWVDSIFQIWTTINTLHTLLLCIQLSLKNGLAKILTSLGYGKGKKQMYCFLVCQLTTFT